MPHIYATHRLEIAVKDRRAQSMQIFHASRDSENLDSTLDVFK